MTDTTETKGLWHRISHDERLRLVTLGGLFYKQKELAELLGTTPGRIARFRLDHDVEMPKKKLQHTGVRFDDLNNLLSELQEVVESPPISFKEDTKLDLEMGYFMAHLIAKQMEEERTMPRWGKCWWPTVPERRGEPVRYTCDDKGSPLCAHHTRELGDKPLMLYLTSPYPPVRTVA